MADLVDLHVRNRNNRVAIPVSASAISFQLFGSPETAAIQFFYNKKRLFIVQMCNLTTIVQDSRSCAMECPAETPHLTNAEWHELWITWHRETVRVGMAGQTDPFIQQRVPGAYNVNIVKVGASNRQWRFYLPPMKPQDQKRKIEGEELRWVRVHDKMPPDAVIGGHENEPLYVIRGPHRGSVTPGKMVPSLGTAFISWGGEAHEVSNFEALVGSNYEWKPTVRDMIPFNAFVAGRSENNENLYIGRISINDHLIVGKVQPSHCVCYVPHQGKETPSQTYEIMVRSDVTIDPRLILDHLEDDIRPHPNRLEYMQSSSEDDD